MPFFSPNSSFDNPMTTSGDIIYGGTAGVATRLPKGTDGQFLSLASGLPSWASSTNANLAYALKTTTYAILTTDAVIGVDGTSAFTVTLPTAVGNTGKVFTIKRVDQTLANAVTIATTSSQTIDGVTTRKLMTQYEQYTVISDGANWLVESHTYPQGWTAYTPTFTGFGTVTVLYGRWKRVGDSIMVESKVTVGTPTATTASISVPSGLTFNTFYTPIRTGNGLWLRDLATAFSSGSMLVNTGNGDVFYFGGVFNNAVVNPLAIQNGDGVIATGNNMAISAVTQVTNWEN